MDLGRLRSTEWILGACSLALLGVMFLDWYSGVGNFLILQGAIDRVELDGANAWQAFAVTDVVLALTAAFGIATTIATATQRSGAIPVALESLTALFATLASIFVFIRVLSLPEDAFAREIGPMLGLPLILGLTLAAWFGIRNERPGHGAHARGAREHIAQIETIPAPER